MITILHIIGIAFFAYLSLLCAVEHGEQKELGMSDTRNFGMPPIEYPKAWAIVSMCITIALASRW